MRVVHITFSFTHTSIEFHGTQTDADIQAPVAMTINFTLGWNIQGSEAVLIRLPRFTRRHQDTTFVGHGHGLYEAPTGQPSSEPTGQPTSQPSGQPTGEPSSQPSSQPSGEPSGQPSTQPTTSPSASPTESPVPDPGGGRRLLKKETEATEVDRRRLDEKWEDFYLDKDLEQTARYLASDGIIHDDYDVEALKYNMRIGDVRLTPSTMFKGGWTEGPWVNNNGTGTMYPSGFLTLVMQDKFNGSVYNDMPGHLQKGVKVSVKIYKENGIGPHCGFPSSDSVDSYVGNAVSWDTFEGRNPNQDPFIITTNFSQSSDDWPYSFHGWTEHMYDGRKDIELDNVTRLIESFNGLGPGCNNIGGCHGKGVCDYCSSKCNCFAGYGRRDDLIQKGHDIAPNCSQQVCPSGRAISDVPTGHNKAHAIAECSNAGQCNRETGTCECFEPWTGAACDRMRCPNDCSGHGICMSMRAIVRLANLLGSTHLSGVYYNKDIEYGALLQDENDYDGSDRDNITAYTTAWDREAMRKCVCDSSWPVGFDYGQRQLGEWFGPDCSLKRCPSGDDPYTPVDERVCQGKNQLNSNYPETGHWGNICHIDCSNRGTCDHSTGKCNCYEGNFGDDCGRGFAAGVHSTQEYANNGTYGTEVYF